MRWQDLKDLFRRAGTVLRADVSLGPDNRSRGYGTVLLATAEDAGRAVDMFNGYSWQTRVLEVRLDRLLPEHDSPLYTSIGSSTTSSSRSSPYPSLPSTSSSQLGSSPSVLDEPEYMSIYRGTDPNSCRNLFVGNVSLRPTCRPVLLFGTTQPNADLWSSLLLLHSSSRFIVNGRISRIYFVKLGPYCALMSL